MENQAEFDSLLLAPLPGKARSVKPTPAELEQEGADFMAFMGTIKT